MPAHIEDMVTRDPENADAVLQKYHPDKADALVAGYAQIHARPDGELLIAWTGDTAVGCGMMRTQSAEAVALQRIFVSKSACGPGLSKAITLALMDQARKDGKTLARLDTGPSLYEAISPCKSLGFVEVAPYHDDTPYLAHLPQFYECQLRSCVGRGSPRRPLIPATPQSAHSAGSPPPAPAPARRPVLRRRPLSAHDHVPAFAG